MRAVARRARRVIHGVIGTGAKAFNRNPWTNQSIELLPRYPVRWYKDDGIWTVHAQPFLDDDRFRRAYRRACQAMGADHGLHWRLHVLLWAATECESLPGAFVECGTAKGFMASGICDYLGWGDRPFYLLDTFEPRKPDATGDQSGGIACQFYADRGPEPVAENFAEWRGARLVVGHVPESLAGVPDGPVAFLHVDMNHPEPEAAAVRHFWPRLSLGAMLIFDDYGHPGYEASMRSADALGAELGFSILCLPTGQGLALKR